MKLEPLTPAPVAVLTERLPEPAVEVAWASRLTEGRGRTVEAAGSNPATREGSNPSAPATYVDDATGASVTEDHWPGDAVPGSE